MSNHTPEPWGAFTLTIEGIEGSPTPRQIAEYVYQSILTTEEETGSRPFLFVRQDVEGSAPDICLVGCGPRGPMNAQLIASAPRLSRRCREAEGLLEEIKSQDEYQAETGNEFLSQDLYDRIQAFLSNETRQSAESGQKLPTPAEIEDAQLVDQVIDRSYAQAWREVRADRERVLELLRGFYDYCTEAGVLFHDECYQKAAAYFAQQPCQRCEGAGFVSCEVPESLAHMLCPDCRGGEA